MTTNDPLPQEFRTIEEFNRVFGTPSVQTFINLFVCWERLSIKELIDKTGLSETQVYLTLKNLVQIHIVEKKARGIYNFADTPFTQYLKIAYIENLKQYLGKELYRITDQIETNPIEKNTSDLIQLIRKWDPFLKAHFKHKMSTLAGYLIDSFLLDH